MRALISAVGTRGDVQPALALALALKSNGHDARLCISPNFVAQAAALGLDARPMGVEMRAPPRGPMPKLSPEELKKMLAALPDLVADQFDTLGAAVDGCDVVIGANAHQYAGPSIAEARGIPCVTAVYAPMAIPGDLPPAPMPGEPASIGDRWVATRKAWNDRSLDRVNTNRAKLGLGPIDDVIDYTLTPDPWLAADPALTARPGTGAWVLADPRPLPAEVESFLGDGPEPVLIGFGSMPATADTLRRLIAAARAAGRRILVSRGWADVDGLDGGADYLELGDVSFDTLFPRLAAVVHHGGAGTTATAARAGVPQLIAPMFSDQFYWGGRIADLGLGATAPQATLTVESIPALMSAVLDAAVAARARSFASQMRSDGATVAAVRLAKLCDR